MQFQGRARNEGDTTFSAKRFLELRNPKVALVWQFMGPRLVTSSIDRGSVGVSAPFEFSLDMLNPPPASVALSQEPAIGSFWLFSDVNGNDRLDRLSHPELAPLTLKLDSFMLVAREAQDSLRDVSLASAMPVPYADTFLLDSRANFVRVHAGRTDTLYQGISSAPAKRVADFLYRRSLVLRDLNGWQKFFAFRKKEWQCVISESPAWGEGKRYIFEDWRRLAPKPGLEGEFEKRVARMSAVLFDYGRMLGEATQGALKKGWLDYPYEGFERSGEDWVAGRSRWYSVLYFPDRASLQRVQDAELSSAFRVEGQALLRTGYNLLHCDDQYRCKVLGPEDSILIDLGETEAYFNPPASAIALPASDSVPRLPEAAELSDYPGEYDYRPFHPITVAISGGFLWADLPSYGALRFEAGKAGVFFHRSKAVQLEFLRGADSGVAKLLCYLGTERWVAPRISSGERVSLLRSRLDSLMAIPSIPFPDALLPALSARLEARWDTLTMARQGEGLALIPASGPRRAFVLIADTLGLSVDSEDRLTLDWNGAGAFRGAWLRAEDGIAYWPNPDYLPRLPAQLFPPEDSQFSLEAGKTLSGSDGTGSDSYIGLGGSKRYACGQDAMFLRPGDGWVSALRPSPGSDSISLPSRGGVMELKVMGNRGRRLALTVRICPDSGSAPTRVRIGLRGRLPGDTYAEIAEAAWFTLAAGGSEVIWRGIPIPDDTYQLEIGMVPTADAPFLLAVDGYRAEAE